MFENLISNWPRLIFEKCAEENSAVRARKCRQPLDHPQTMDLVIHAGTLSVRDPSKDHFVERFAPFP